jgi:hypothetical protein
MDQTTPINQPNSSPSSQGGGFPKKGLLPLALGVLGAAGIAYAAYYLYQGKKITIPEAKTALTEVTIPEEMAKQINTALTEIEGKIKLGEQCIQSYTIVNKATKEELYFTFTMNNHEMVVTDVSFFDVSTTVSGSSTTSLHIKKAASPLLDKAVKFVEGQIAKIAQEQGKVFGIPEELANQLNTALTEIEKQIKLGERWNKLYFFKNPTTGEELRFRFMIADDRHASIGSFDVHQSGPHIVFSPVFDKMYHLTYNRIDQVMQEQGKLFMQSMKAPNLSGSLHDLEKSLPAELVQGISPDMREVLKEIEALMQSGKPWKKQYLFTSSDGAELSINVGHILPDGSFGFSLGLDIKVVEPSHILSRGCSSMSSVIYDMRYWYGLTAIA